MVGARALWTLWLLGLVACGGQADVGQACENVGNRDDCVEGAICTNEAAADAGQPYYVCRALCQDKEDCTEGSMCNGVAGTNLKSCQPTGVAASE